MTKIFVNNHRIDISGKKDILLRDFVNYLLDEHLSSNEVLTEIDINGKKNLINDSILAHNVGDFDTICFQSKSGLDFIAESVNSCSLYIDTMIEKILSICDAYSQGEIQQMNHTFVKVTEDLGLFMQLVSGIQKGLVLHMSEKFDKSDRMKNLENHLLHVMQSLLTAREKNDLSMLCDLLEYELVENLKKWNALVIPQMKESLLHRE